MSLIGLIAALAQFAHAEISGELAAASAPLTEGVPEVAVLRLRALLNRNLADADWRATAEKLAEALLAADQANDALSLLNDPRLSPLRSTKFWRAQALASSQRPAEALPSYEEVAVDEQSPFRSDAIFGAAEMLRALGRSDEALARFRALSRDKRWGVRARLRAAEIFLDNSDPANARRLLQGLQPQTSAEKKERQFLRGRLALATEEPEKAVGFFQSILKKPAGATHAVLMATLCAVADAHLQLKTPEAADDLLEDFIERHPHDADLELIFAKLDQLYRAERKPSRSALERWAHENEQPRRTFAQWQLARIQLRVGNRDRALELFEALRKDGAGTAASAAPLLEFAQLKVEDRDYNTAIAILEQVRALRPEPALLDRINLLAAETHYRARRFEAATAGFEQVAHSTKPLAQISTFNAALGWLQLGNHPQFLAAYNELEKEGGDLEARAELRLEEGLALAARADPRAAESLQAFLRDFPASKRASEAWVALAELAFHAAPPRLDEARKNLARAAESKPTAAAAERSDYLLIWIEETMGGNNAKVIELARRFLEQHAASAFAADVRMKLAEAYYRIQDFANAQTHFEILAEQNPAGPLAEKALFFAAESAMSSMGTDSLERALVLFDRVVRGNGELKWAARNEQAAIERKLGKPQDALALYEEVLKGEARPPEKREALCGKGDVFFEMGGSDPKNYRRAIELYDQLAADPSAPIHWRNQALFKKGVCEEKEFNRAAALATFYRVLDNESRPDRPGELFWFYKAGFNAGRLLENDSKWESAAAIYQRLAAVGGVRSEEAKARLDRLRLEHFLWEE